MKALRGLLVVVVLLNLALLAVFLEVRGMRLRYALAKKQQQARAVVEANQSLALAVARAKRPDALNRKAQQFGILVK